MLRKSLFILLFGFLAANTTAEENGVAGDPELKKAGRLLRAALDDDSPAGEPQSRRLTGVAERAIAMLGEHHLATEMLRSGIKQADNLDEFRSVFEDVHAMLTFEPIVEAEMPQGFPRPTPVGKVEIKQYPEYRRARCESAASTAFFTLFRHITTNKVEMTAPVEMSYQLQDEKQPRAKSMAFLYESTQIGSLGRQLGDVEVDDVSPQTVLSIGMRGDTSPDQIDVARRALNVWLKDNSARYESVGALRVMGYNSPFVPASRRYFEVQIPLREKMG